MITLNDAINFVQGNYYTLLDRFTEEGVPVHIKEQALYRAMQCGECLTARKCQVCKCGTPNLFFAPNKTDSLGRWDKMLDKEKWEKFKEENNIDLPDNFDIIMEEAQRNVLQLKWFKPNEFVMGGLNVYDRMDPAFLIQLDELRGRCDTPFKIISSFRDEAYNKKVGGVKDSYHLKGRAVDIQCTDAGIRAKIMREALMMNLSVGVMNNALHIDNGDNWKVFHYYPRFGNSMIEQQMG